MRFTIYGSLRSGVFSSEAALAEAEAPYRLEIVSLDDNEQKSPAFRAVNPSGKVPALKLPEGGVVTESMAILLTIADRFPEAQLLPDAGSAMRAQAYRWLAYMAGEIYPMVEIADYPERFGGSEALRELARGRIRESLLLLDQTVEGPWFLGERFSALDIYAVMFTRWRGTIGRDWLEGGHLPRLWALAQRLSQRPRIAPVWRKHFGRD